MSVPYWLSNQNKKKITTDTLIIGGGISGVSLAYFLEKYSNKNVCVVEKHSLGYGASSRNAGFISTGSLTLFDNMVAKYGQDKALEMKLFYKKNHDLIKKEFFTDDLNYKVSGSVSLKFKEDEERLSSHLEFLNKNGFSYKSMSTREVKSEMNVEGTLGGYLDSQDGQIHPHKLLTRINHSLKNGVIEHQEIYSVTHNVALTNDYEIHFKEVVFALNSYSSLLVPELDQLIKPVRGQMMVLGPGEKIMNHNGYASKMLCYFRQLPQGEFLIGGFRRVEENTEVGFSDHGVSNIIQRCFKDFIKIHIPKLKDRPVINQWSGIMGFSYDENPLVGQLSPNRYVIGGYTGHGMGKAVACAESLAKHMISNTDLPNFIDIKRVKNN